MRALAPRPLAPIYVGSTPRLSAVAQVDVLVIIDPRELDVVVVAAE